MPFVLCDQCGVYLRCDASAENCPEKCSDACFHLGYHHMPVFNWLTLAPLVIRARQMQDVIVNPTDARIVAEGFSWSAAPGSSQGIGSVADNRALQ